MEKIKKGDFVEFDFTAKVKDGEVFDTSIEDEAKKHNLIDEKHNKKFEPLRICVGLGMTLKGVDNALINKEPGKEYEIEIPPQDAFGKRNPGLIKIFSLSSFTQKGMMPERGVFINLNGLLAKIVSVSGGRVVVDFNNPLADKYVIYKIKINRIISEEKEKIECIAKFYFEEYEIEEKEKKFELIVKGKKIANIEKKIKELFPDLEIRYQVP